MSLRLRLLIAAAAVVLAMAGVGYSLIRTVETSQTQQIDRQLDTVLPIAAGMAGGNRPPGSRPRPRLPSSLADRSGLIQLSDMYVAVVKAAQRQTVASPSSAGGAVPKLPAVAQSLAAGTPRPTTVGSLHGSGRWRAVNLRTASGQQVLVAIYMGPVDATTARLQEAVLAAGGIVAALLLACGFWLERLGLRPIAEMTAVADAIAAGDRTRRISPTPRGAEAAHLARALNAMLDTQHDTEVRLRQFVADASHELRTPTSVISGLADLWRQGDLREGDELDDAMRRVGQESSRMRALVEELLLLTRLDSGGHFETAPVDVGDLARDVVADAGITHPGRSIRTDIAEGAVTCGDGAGLRRVLSNLVNNALIHTPPSSPVTLSVWRAPGEVTFQVGDGGPGMASDDAARAFERFWRAERSRTRPGSGLGLSIARAVVEAHGGHIALRSSPEEGSVVTVTLPGAGGIPTAAVASVARADRV